MLVERKDFLYLSGETLQGLAITSAQVIERLEKLILGSADNTVWSAPKSAISTGDGRYMMATLSASDSPQLIAVKALLVNPRNPRRDLDSINAIITLLDSETGLPVAVLDGNWITAVRTACASAIAAVRMAGPESRSIAFIGCGVQANSHLKVFCEIFPISEIRALGRGAKNRDALCAAARDIGLTATASDNAKDAVEGADIVVTSIPVSSTDAPFLDARWLKPGAFAAITDHALPWLPESLSAFERIIIDDLAQEAEMPTPMVDPELVQGDITGLVTNRVSGRNSADQRCAFIFRSVALGDLALAGLAYEVASAATRGLKIEDR